ncbi:MAG TPA: hypothetical protein VNO70_07080 [Blastocatellia bacterium]|nr:hypothetical protein [Blastocatellia bacterium]
MSILEDAKRMAVDPALGLILVHWSVPHLPVIYNRRAGDFTWNKECNYLDNLALADRALGEVRRAMEAAGLWDSAVVLVTSDHPLKIKRWANKFPHIPAEDAAAIGRGLDPRIPFVLKLAGQQESITFDPAMNTVLTHDLFLGLLRGELSTPESVVSWLERRRSDAEGVNH